MGDISAQQKLQLTRQVRERYYQDRQDLGQREQILYGRPISYFEEEPVPDYGEVPDYGNRYGSGNERSGTLGLRILLAAILVCLLALADRRGDTLFGLTGRQIGEYIRQDFTPQLGSHPGLESE